MLAYHRELPGPHFVERGIGEITDGPDKRLNPSYVK
jgi:hypothetical protein